MRDTVYFTLPKRIDNMVYYGVIAK